MKLLLVLNKMDLCKPLSKARSVVESVRQYLPNLPEDQIFFTSFFPKLKGVPQLADRLFASTQPGEWEYPPTVRTDQSQIELVNEIIREKIFHRVHQEIPYRVRITNTGWTHLNETTMRIDVLLEVDTKQQKLILTGHNGSMLQFITTRSITEIQELLGKKVFLFLKCSVSTTL